MQTRVIMAVALAASLALPAVGRAGSDREVLPTAPTDSTHSSILGFRRGTGLSLNQPLTERSALAFRLSSGPQKDLPEVRVMVGVQYVF